MLSHPKPRWYFLIRRYVSENWTHILGLVRNGGSVCLQANQPGCRPKKGIFWSLLHHLEIFESVIRTDGLFFCSRHWLWLKKSVPSTNQSSIKWKWNIFFSKMMNGTCQCIPWRIWRLHLLVRQIGGTEIQGLAAYWYIRRSKSGGSEFDFLQLGFAWQTEHTKDPLKIEEFHEIQIWNVEASKKQHHSLEHLRGKMGHLIYLQFAKFFQAAKTGLNQGKRTRFCRMFAHAKMGAV